MEWSKPEIILSILSFSISMMMTFLLAAWKGSSKKNAIEREEIREERKNMSEALEQMAVSMNTLNTRLSDIAEKLYKLQLDHSIKVEVLQTRMSHVEQKCSHSRA